MLHEATAVIPLVGLFYGARTLGVGERIVEAVIANSGEGEPSWAIEKCRIWVNEGEQWTGRVGRRYGFFGYQKGENPQDGLEHRLAGDIANAVFAYGVTKVASVAAIYVDFKLIFHYSQALLPVRIALSLYLSPAASRGIVEPFRAQIMRVFRSKSS